MTRRAAALAPSVLTSGRLVLRPVEESDEPAVAEALRDPGILRWAVGTAVAAAPEAQRARRWVRSRAGAWSSGTAAFAVVGAADGALLGSVSVRDVDRLPDQAAVTYWTAPWARGRGVAARALEAASRWALGGRDGGGLGLHRLWLDHALANEASCRVALRTGFRYEGTMRDFYLDASGRRHDSHLHARLATDRG
ncbi:GNAT family N-acetyltransferase [Allonocardiopsis opalescens]|uniref:RimJ/RimL family protein N-acetyltransferase n=1 Tax=Allonocardiopsis opalescens TaxID=1144618 RepID=A0A2T0PZV3_9ACTN|nr:GNAT family protein [Allonocardiopsis opalescens]PRX97046.1 RimJ/RimL family protein N-acetyltransferase [Allonocardiopsis opalescens]